VEIFTLEISFPGNESDDPWSRVIEVKESFTLRQLHKYIQKLVGFDDDHLYEFYIGKNPRNKSGSVPKNAKLNDVYPLTGCKIYYLFDFGDCWLFQIKKSLKRLNEDEKVKYPRLIKSIGVSPEQYLDYDE
jgi:hypothetical protein